MTQASSLVMGACVLTFVTTPTVLVSGRSQPPHPRSDNQRISCLYLMPSTRNLVVHIDPRQPIRIVAASLAHKFYHVAEIERAPEVVDSDNLRALYERIGEPTRQAITRPGNTGQIVALAHHAYAGECDFNRPVEISGELLRVMWVNPHVWIAIRTNARLPVTWWIEGDAPYALYSRGWTSASLPTHVQVAARGYAARYGPESACGCQLALADQRTVVLSACGR